MPREQGEDGMKDLSDKANYERLLKDVEAVKTDIADLANQLSEALNDLAGTAQKQARRGAKQAKSAIDSVMSDVSKHGNTAFDAAQQAASSLEDTLEEAVTQRPIAAVAIALGFGFLIGVTWRR
ncbi:DUF883 family protein [Bradyrhizobium sp. 2TAF24]|uniref:DUF883 family protein n=1 Tax=Bradyrhizobium sp. 2TAF24 TaxID=3233011 RepID=UPI003F93F71B